MISAYSDRGVAIFPSVRLLPGLFLTVAPLFSLFILAGCNQPEPTTKMQFTGQTQGTYYAVTCYAPDDLHLRPAIDSILQAVDQTASLWMENSLVNRVNRNEEVVVNDLFTDLFRISQEVSEATGGSFDITVGPLVDAWGFGPSGAPSIRPGVVDSLLPLVNYRNLQIRNGGVVKQDPRIRLDFNAVAQGYTVDLIARLLESRGVESYLVDIGGEVYAQGTKPGRKPWVVGIESPAGSLSGEREISAELPIDGKAVATSGNYRRYYVRDGVRYSHTIDPATGYPVSHSMLSVTVVSARCAYADAYATAFMVMGPERTMQFLRGNQPGPELFFIYSDSAGAVRTYASDGLKRSLREVQPVVRE